MERCWHVGARQPWRTADVFQRSPGPFVRPDRENRQGRVLVIGQWGLVPWFAETPKLTYSTTNARFEEITTKASFKSSWTYGKRCIIPAVSFDELNWESGKNVWWRFRRADGAPWALAGLWNTGTDKTTGEAAESYPMLTLNADLHRLMNRMHKPDRKLLSLIHISACPCCLAPLPLAAGELAAARPVRHGGPADPVRTAGGGCCGQPGQHRAGAFWRRAAQLAGQPAAADADRGCRPQ